MYEENELEELAPGLVVIITLIGGFLRVLLLANKGMWLDETFSVWLANHNVSEMLHWIVQIDQHPPLYYLLLHYWIGFNGDTPYYVRLLSALIGAATIPLMYLIGKRMSGEVAGLAAAVFLAFSPFHIRFAQETRMYTLLTFNAAVAIYTLVRLLTDARSSRPIGSQLWEYLHNGRTQGPVAAKAEGEFSYQEEASQQPGWRGWLLRQRWNSLQVIETDLAWIGFIVFSAATLLSHNTAVFFPLATNLFVLGLVLVQKKTGPSPAFQAPSLGNWLKAQLAIFLLWSPWLPSFITQASRVYQEFWIPAPTWNTVTQVLKSFFNEALPMPGQISQVFTVWIPYGLALCLGLWYYRKNIARSLFLVTLFAVPFLGELLVSLRRPIFYDRTLIWITIPLFLLLAAGIAQLRFRFLVLLAVGILGANNLFAASDYYRFYPKEDWNSAAREVVAFIEKDDLVLFNATWVQIPFDYYSKTFNLNSIQVEKYNQVEKHGVPVDLFANGILEPKMTESDVPNLLAMLNGHKRVWLVYSHNWYTDPKNLIPQTLATQMNLLQKSDYYGVQIQLYGTP